MRSGTRALASLKWLCLRSYWNLSRAAQRLLQSVRASGVAIAPRVRRLSQAALGKTLDLSYGLFLRIQGSERARGEADTIRRLHDEASRHISHAVHLLTLFCLVLLVIIVSIPSTLSF